MPNKSITDFRNLTDTDKNLLVWQGLQDTWTKLMETIEHQKEIEADTKVHQKLLVTGNGAPSVMEQLRNHQRFIDNVGKLVWMFIGAVVIQIVSFIGIAVWAVAQLSKVIK